MMRSNFFLDEDWNREYEIDNYIYTPSTATISKYEKTSGGPKVHLNSTKLRNKENELFFLITSNYPNIATRDMLLDKLWFGYNETSANSTLTQTLKGVRSAFGDDGKKLILTVPRVGFRLSTCQLAQSNDEKSYDAQLNIKEKTFTQGLKRTFSNHMLLLGNITFTITLLIIFNFLVTNDAVTRLYGSDNDTKPIVTPINNERIVIDKYNGAQVICRSSLKDGYCHQTS
ncbi:transcriptional regulator [Aeromonas veronii]